MRNAHRNRDRRPATRDDLNLKTLTGKWLRGVAAVSALLLAGAVLAAALYWHDLSKPRDDFLRARPGRLIEQKVMTQPAAAGEVIENLVLRSDTGLVVDARVRRPETPTGAVLPVVVILGGHRTGRNATDLVGELSGIAYAAIDYPYRGSVDVYGLGDALRLIPGLQRALLDTPPALIVLLHWLQEQPWVDGRQIELAGVSLGVPFAAAAGGLDNGYSRLWLVHGGMDNRAWLDFALRRHIDSDRLRAAVSATLLQLVNGASFDTLGWIRRTAPRPVIAITARDDERVPAGEARLLQDAESAGLLELIATDGRHIGPDRDNELRRLLGIVQQRVLQTRAEIVSAGN